MKVEEVCFVLVCKLLHYKDRIFYLFPDLCVNCFITKTEFSIFSTLLILFVKKSEHAFDVSIRQAPNARGITFEDMLQRAFFSLN